MRALWTRRRQPTKEIAWVPTFTRSASNFEQGKAERPQSGLKLMSGPSADLPPYPGPPWPHVR